MTTWWRKAHYLMILFLFAIMMCVISVLAILNTAYAEGPESYSVMHPDAATLKKWNENFLNAEKIPSVSLSIQDIPASYNVLNHLEYTASERNQDQCGNCWVWAGTGIVEVALHTQLGVKDRLSIQYLNSCYTDRYACCGADLYAFAQFYGEKRRVVPWANPGASWMDGGPLCACDQDHPSDSKTAQACLYVEKSPFYPIETISPQVITTHNVSQGQAIQNIKSELLSNKGIFFAFFMPNRDAFLDFLSEWQNMQEGHIWTPGPSFDDQWVFEGNDKGSGHAVLCVGYVDNGPGDRYWIMLNSWGTAEGLRPNGFFLLNMDVNYDLWQSGQGWAFRWETLDLSFAILVPILLNPTNNEKAGDLTPFFDWADVPTASHYEIEISRSADFSTVDIMGSPTDSYYTPLNDLLSNTTYYWRVRAWRGFGFSDWSEIWSFSTSGGGSSDATPPTANWVSPASGQTVSSQKLYLQANASDNSSGVNRVAFSGKWGGNWYGVYTDDSAPYAYEWDLCASSVPDGDIELGLEAWDNAGNHYVYSEHYTNYHITKNHNCSGAPPSGDGVQLCDGTNYGSPCQTFTEGTHNNLGSVDGVASSLRFLGSYVNAGYHVVLYDDYNLGGQPGHFDGDWTDLGSETSGWSNRAKSMKIERSAPPTPPPSGGVTLCSDANWRGTCKNFTASDSNLNDDTLGNQVSSIKLYGNYCVDLFDDVGYGGQQGVFQYDIDDLAPHNWDNRAESVRLRDCDPLPCLVTLWEDTNYQGTHRTFYQDDGNLHNYTLGNKVSSLDLEGNCTIRLFDNIEFQGQDGIFDEDKPDLHPHNWGDRAESFRMWPRPPEPPTNLSITSISSWQLDLSWSGASGTIQGYKIFRDETQIAQVGSDVSTYQDKNLNCGTRYTYYVKSFSSAGDSSASGTISYSTQPCPADGVTLCQHINYEGLCRHFSSDDPDLSNEGLLDEGSSLRVHGYRIIDLYDYTNYGGESVSFQQNVPNLHDFGWGDRAASLKVRSSDTTPPTGQILYPLDESYHSVNSIPIYAEANDAGTGVDQVQFFSWHNDGTGYDWHFISADSDGSDGWSAAWDTIGVADQESIGLDALILDKPWNRYDATVWNLVLDRQSPSSAVDALPVLQPNTWFLVTWSGSDNVAGVASYDVQYTAEGWSGWYDWLAETTETSAWFNNAIDGYTYRFRCRARDLAGNLEPYPVEADTSTTVQACGTASPDAYEVDNVYTEARTIQIGDVQRHNFHEAGDQDWIAFEATGGVAYTLQTALLEADCDTYLFLYDVDGTTVLRENDDIQAGVNRASRIEGWVAPGDGRYYAMVRHWNQQAGGCGTNYDFQITAVQPEEYEGTGKITYVSNRDGNDEIYVMDADGSNQTRLTNNSVWDGSPDWSPGGRQIVFASDRDGNRDLYKMDADGTGLTRLTNNSTTEWFPDWSPDGTKIAFNSARDGNWEIYVMNADGTNSVRLTNRSNSDWSPAWSPDGTRIAFDSGTPGLRDNEICVMNADGSELQCLTTNTAYDGVPVWSPDGTKIAFVSDRDGNSEIYIMDADGSNPTRLTNNPAEEFTLAWSPDGKHIAFTSDRDGNDEIYAMNPDGTGVVCLTDNAANDSDPDWGVTYSAQSVGHWEIAGSLNQSRYDLGGVLLQDGRVLVATGHKDHNCPSCPDLLDSSEIYDPDTETWHTTGPVNAPRMWFNRSMAVLDGGKVLLTGGTDISGWRDFASSELYDPATGFWSYTGNLNTSRRWATLTKLDDGRVLIAGGAHGLPVSSRYLTSSEIFDPATGTWAYTGNLNRARESHVAVRLQDGRVLLAGGYSATAGIGNIAEIYNPATGTWSITGSMTHGYTRASLTLLADGRALFVGGEDNGTFSATAEIFDPTMGTWVSAASMNAPRTEHEAVLLPDGRVLIAGGRNSTGNLSTCEIYDPTTNSWIPGPDLHMKLGQHRAILLPDGDVLVVGAPDASFTDHTCELYTMTEEAIRGLSAANNGPTSLGGVTTLTASVTSGKGVNYTWSLGDGGTGNSSVVTHTYSTLGDYTAVVTASNSINAATTSTTVKIVRVDTDDDGDVDIVDVMNVADRWGSASGGANYEASYDFDHDGDIDVRDIMFIVRYWGQVSLETDMKALSEQAEVVASSLTLEPNDVELAVGESLTVSIRIEDIDALGGFDLVLGFDPDVLEMTGVELGEFPGSTGNAAQLLGPIADTELELVRFGGFSFGANDKPSGSGTLATVTFEAIRSGMCDLVAQAVKLTGEMSTELRPANVTGGQVTVAAGAGIEGSVYLPVVIKEGG